MSNTLPQNPKSTPMYTSTAHASAAAAGNMMLPLTTNRMVSTSASNPEMPMTMP